jgi:hypothetical protein
MRVTIADKAHCFNRRKHMQKIIAAGVMAITLALALNAGFADTVRCRSTASGAVRCTNEDTGSNTTARCRQTANGVRCTTQ